VTVCHPHGVYVSGSRLPGAIGLWSHIGVPQYGQTEQTVMQALPTPRPMQRQASILTGGEVGKLYTPGGSDKAEYVTQGRLCR